MRYKWLLIDADGTILDFERAQFAALTETFDGIGIEFNLELLRSYHKESESLWEELETGTLDLQELSRQRFVRVLRKAAIETDPIALSQKYLSRLALQGQTLPGALETCQILSEKYDLYLATNGFGEVQRSRMELAGLAGFFKEYLISEELGHAKPDPGFFAKGLMGEAEIVHSQVLMVGDSLTSDIQGANNVGIDCCWIAPHERELPTGYRIDYRIESIGELPTLLEASHGD
ncbi:MAG: YjjG family noncanonical pyrimidine nucleotidase [Tissierellia bacterium]|nr:YjjG family noncanonical pyrimidine nucleotidase [Tissierellia bacterium]